MSEEREARDGEVDRAFLRATSKLAHMLTLANIAFPSDQLETGYYRPI